MVSIKENAGMRGAFRLRVYQKGCLVETFDNHNMIVDNARSQMALLIAGDGEGRHITHIAFGTNGNPPSVSDDSIAEPYLTEIDNVEFSSKTQIRFNWSLGANEANGKTIMEFGLLCEDGTLFARYVREKPLNKESDFSLEGDWTIEF